MFLLCPPSVVHLNTRNLVHGSNKKGFDKEICIDVKVLMEHPEFPGTFTVQRLKQFTGTDVASINCLTLILKKLLDLLHFLWE